MVLQEYTIGELERLGLTIEEAREIEEEVMNDDDAHKHAILPDDRYDYGQERDGDID